MNSGKRGRPWRAWTAPADELKSTSLSKLEDMFLRFCASRFPGDTIGVVEELLEVVMDIRKTRVGKDLMEEGRKEGRKRGRKEGREEGRMEGLKRALSWVVEVRFGPVPADIAGWIDACVSSTRLEALHRQALSDPDLETFRGRLQSS